MNLVFRRSLQTVLCVLAFCLGPASCQAQNGPASNSLRLKDRIVFIGDSITGQGGNFPNGWTHLMEEALAAAHPGETRTLTALGGSGQTVGSWTGIEKRSRDQETFLDVKGVDVKATLNGGADVLVIMLGMNDILSPSLNKSADAPDRWKAKYTELIDAVKARAKPRLIALATAPLCTEDPKSPKNLMIGQLNARIAELAKEKNALVLPVHQSEWDALARGRQVNPNYHLTGDFVHPSASGHVAIATGMLRGLGEEAAAKYLVDKYETPAIAKAAGGWPALSYAVRTQALPTEKDDAQYQLRYWWTTDPAVRADVKAPKIELTAPDGWKVTRLSATPATGAFDVRGTPDHLVSSLHLTATDGVTTREQTISIPAPWLVGNANIGGNGWINGNTTFDPGKGQLPADAGLSTGADIGKPIEIAPQRALVWRKYQASVDYVGGATPGNVDFAGVDFFTAFEIGYGARWINAPRETKVQFKIGTQAFSGNDYLTLWVNGEKIYGAPTRAGKGQLFDATLKPGWNAVVFKSNHLQWQWQFSVDMLAAAGEDLSGLMVSTEPKN